MRNPPGANREPVPLSQEPATKTGSGSLPPDTAALQGWGGETFHRDACDGLAAIPKMCLPRRSQKVSSRLPCIQPKQTKQKLWSKQGHASRTKLQVKKSVNAQDGVGGFEAITHCCVLSNEINPFICSRQAAEEQFSLQWQASSFTFLLTLSLMRFQSSKQTHSALSSANTVVGINSSCHLSRRTVSSTGPAARVKPKKLHLTSKACLCVNEGSIATIRQG